jgi:hypothetical protein
MHLNLDDSAEYAVGNENARLFMTRLRDGLNQANYIQGYTSLVNHVRQYQQEMAVLGMMDKVVRTITEGNKDMFELGGRMQRDLGLDQDHYDNIKKLIDNGTIVVKTENTKIGPITYVDRLNLDKWDEDLAQDFASALNRNMNQVVQQAMAGETSRWMHTVWGSALTHLQTFPILAIQKQFFRNAASRDGQAVAMALAAYGTAYAALSMRDAITGTDRSTTERAKAAFGYSNITGWMPLYSDPIMTVLGLEDMRFNTFGPYAKPMSVPIVDTMNNLYRVPGAAAQALSGTNNWTDNQAIRSVPFFRLVESAVRMGSFGNVELLNRTKPEPEAKPTAPLFNSGNPAPTPRTPEEVRSIMETLNAERAKSLEGMTDAEREAVGRSMAE